MNEKLKSGLYEDNDNVRKLKSFMLSLNEQFNALREKGFAPNFETESKLNKLEKQIHNLLEISMRQSLGSLEISQN